MATHSSVLAWRIPGTAEPDGLLSMGSHRVGHDWSDLAAAEWPLRAGLESPWMSVTLPLPQQDWSQRAHGLKNTSGSDFPSVFHVFPAPGITSLNNWCIGSAFGGTQAKLYVSYAPQTPRKCYHPSPTSPYPTPLIFHLQGWAVHLNCLQIL